MNQQLVSLRNREASIHFAAGYGVIGKRGEMFRQEKVEVGSIGIFSQMLRQLGEIGLEFFQFLILTVN